MHNLDIWYKNQHRDKNIETTFEKYILGIAMHINNLYKYLNPED